MKNLRIEAHSPEWYEQRMKRFTASRLYELVCKPKDNPRPYIIEKAAEILTGESQDADFISEDMAHGVEYEPLAIKHFSRLTGIKVEERSEFILNEELNFGATPDRVGYNEKGEKVILEVKCPKSKTHIKYCLLKDADDFKKKLPKYYYQCIGGAICEEATKAVFISFDPRIDSKCGLFVLQFDIPDEDIEIAKEAIKKANAELKELLTLLTPNTQRER